MKVNDLFPKFNVYVTFRDLGTNAGEYWHKSDIIVLDKSLIKAFPLCYQIVKLHEMFHSTGSSKRLSRIQRLEDKFGGYAPDSLSYRVEECIIEIACMVAATKMQILNNYTINAIIPSLKKYYTPDMYIPVREIRAALKYFANDDTSFEVELQETKEYLEAYLDIKFQETYSQSTISA